MYSFFKCFCFIWILKNVLTETNESMFNTMALGHSGLLVYWKPIEYGNGRRLFYLQYKTTGKGNQSSNSSIDVEAGQYMISSLTENTEYDITIKEYYYKGPVTGSKLINTYILKGKTDLKTNSAPAKPDIKCDLKTEYKNGRLLIKIMWIPCGTRRVCEGKNSGTHFLIKYRCLESRKTIIRNYTKTYEGTIFVYSGKIYEVMVTSVNGDFQTDSDPREFFINPVSSSVRYVKVLPLNESSAMISWKAPKELIGKIQSYTILACARLSDDKEADVSYEIHLPSCKSEVHSAAPYFDYETAVISNLTAGVSYTFVIVPSTDDFKDGTEYLINYIPQAHDDNLPVAMSDINYAIWKYDDYQCRILLQWLPCGKMFDCHNTRPGYNYRIEHKKATDSLYTTYEPHSEYNSFVVGSRIVVGINQTYDLKIISMRGSVNSAPFLKKMVTDNCKKVRD